MYNPRNNILNSVFIMNPITLLAVILAIARCSCSLITDEESGSGLLQKAKSHGLLLTTPVSAEFNKTYNDTIKDGKIINYEYKYNISEDFVTPIRIFSTSKNVSSDFPTIFVIREERSVLSWQIPLILHYTYEYIDVSRTLCPLDSNQVQPIHQEQTFYVEVSSQASHPVPFSIRAEVIQDFIIDNGERTVTSSPSNPAYYMYIFPKNVDSVLIKATSSDKKCAILSIQDIKCPVFDLDTDVEYQGKYQTMTKQGAITVNRDDYSKGSFYIVIAVKPNDVECTNGINTIHPAGLIRTREKNVTLSIKEAIPSSQYYKAILAALSVFIAFYLVALFIGIFYHGCKDNWGMIDVSTYERSISQDDSRRHLVEEVGATGYGSISNPVATQGASNRAPRELGDIVGDQGSQDNTDAAVDQESVDSGDYDMVKDADHDKNIIHTKTALFVCDLSKKNEKRADKNYRLYAKNLLTIAVFYGLPVIQLVMTYQKVLNFTGDQDICYYNFACAHPFGRVSSFNNIFSNIGYVMLGVLFIILVMRRSYLHKRAVDKSAGRHKLFGIPQHFGLFYAMGLALIMEGVMSACYHVCPTASNFQFDTSFMYIMGCLCILKIYQNRHPDISAKAHTSYLVMALIIIIAVIGVIYGTNIFWIIFAILYMTASLILSVHLYYMGVWKLDRYVCKRLFHLIVSDWLSCSKPVYPNRMVLLVIGTIVNWSIALYGGIKSPPDFASLLLGIVIVNLIIYTTFYIFMKKIAKEKIPKLTMVLILLSLLTWAFALYFFLAHLTTWQLTPAGSREGNQECILFQFYDKHDVWHFLSAISLFFSFLVLLTLDDEIILMRRDKIPVF